ncbi:hypothetical protein GDO86_016498 [Hymenochirus boettgeri]|uniref:HORMA domain-containing protein n=1 Tax=Hymenochirus boettgeri TaxID=247094 RepID=A0A8T2K3A3_9PIPI|nr:hypothetical protein GDO86_016498 [Hymenochirus boettgeri]
MLGCYDALKKKYLRMVVLAIYTDPEDPQTITECYQFKFKYTPGGPVMDFVSNRGSSSSTCLDVKKGSIMLIRKLYVLMQNLGPLPNDVCLTMKLFYYDEVTPADYQPPGFKAGSCEGVMFEGEPMYLNVGELATPFHVLKVKVTTEKDRMENIEKTILKSETNTPPAQGNMLDEGKGENTDHSINDQHEVEWQRTYMETLNVAELNLTCEDDDEIEDSVCSQNTERSDSKKEKLSPMIPASGLKTRSGRIFQNSGTALRNKKTPASHSVGSEHGKKEGKRIQLNGSQEDPAVPKRRKFSEPSTPL